MSKQNIIFIVGIILVVTLAVMTANFSNFVGMTKHGNYVLVDAKIHDRAKDIYYIKGHDPHVFQSEAMDIYVNEEQFNQLQEGTSYFMNYVTFSDKKSELKTFELDSRYKK